MVITFKIQRIMNYTQFSSISMQCIHVKVHLFNGHYSLISLYIPSDWYSFICQEFKENLYGVPIVPLSYYLYLLRFRKKFLKYVHSTKTVNSNN